MLTNSLHTSISYCAYFLLMAAIASLWITSRSLVWLGLTTLAVIAAWVSSRIDYLSGLTIGLYCYCCFAFFRIKGPPSTKIFLGLLVLVLSFLLGAHKFTGFNNLLFLSNVTLSQDSFPIHLYLNFDKPLLGLFLIGWGFSTVKTWREWQVLFRNTAYLLISACIILLGVSLISGYVRVDFKWFNFSGAWLAANLFFTCVAEEAFFRGYILHQLDLLLKRWPYGSNVALLLSSMLFGLAHFPGGWLFVCLASLAGLFYGSAFQKTQKIEASILIHFSVNAVHFVAFTYPALKVSQ